MQRRATTEMPGGGEGRLRLALGLLSAAVTAHQLVVMQVLGYVHWHHFAYMVVAVALLGFGAAGTVLTLWRAALLPRASALLPWLVWGMGAAMVLGLSLSQQAAVAFDLHLLFVEPRQWLALGLLYSWLLPAFFLGGLATSLVLTSRAREAGRYYFANLVGAGAGGVVGVLAVEWVAPERSVSVVVVVALAALACLLPEVRARGRIGLAVLGLLTAAVAIRPIPLRPSQFKPIALALDLPGAQVVTARSSAQGWLQVVEAPGLRPAPPLSLNFPGTLPVVPAVFINGYGYGTLPGPAEWEDPSWLDWTPSAVGWAAGQRSRVLLLEPGPGGAAAYARAKGAQEVVVVEPHRALVDLMTTGRDHPVSEWALPGVRVERTTGRHYLRQAEGAFDLVVFPSTGSIGGAGLTATTEQFLLTKEAFREAWERLAPGGALVVSAPLEFPVRPALRVLATLVEAAEEAGVANVRSHLLAVRSWSSVAYLLHRDPIDAATVAAVRVFSDDRSFDPLLLPDLQPEERDAYNAWPDPGFFTAVDALLGPERAALYRDYAFRLRPATDGRPWFGQFLRWDRLGVLRDGIEHGRLPFLELGTVMVALTFVQLAVLAVVLILLPVRRLRGVGSSAGSGSTVLYFAGLGAGFMLVEIGLMIRLHAWLGSPLLSAAVVLTGLLIFAGLGSQWSERWVAVPQRRVAIVGGCILAIAVGALLVSLGSRGTIGAPTTLQALVALLVMAPVGFALGQAFPVGLRDLERTAPERVPWAWAINGCVSVATPAGAMLLALEWGTGALFALAGLAYALAALGALRDATRAAPG
jgi:hypothetical protein